MRTLIIRQIFFRKIDNIPIVSTQFLGKYQAYNEKTVLKIYPPGSKCEALRLGVHLILLYFIKIGILSAETFFLFWWMVGGGWWVVGGVPLFGSSNLFILIWYILLVYVYIFSYSDNFRQNSCGFNFVIKLNFFLTIFKIPLLG